NCILETSEKPNCWSEGLRSYQSSNSAQANREATLRSPFLLRVLWHRGFHLQNQALILVGLVLWLPLLKCAKIAPRQRLLLRSNCRLGRKHRWRWGNNRSPQAP